MPEPQTGFIITRNWRESDQRIELELWLSTDSGPQCLLVPGQEAVFFVASREIAAAGELLADRFSLRMQALTLHDFRLQPVTACYFTSQRQLRQARERLFEAGIDVLEADVNPVDRYLMERFVFGTLSWVQTGGELRVRGADYTPQLKMLSIDIEKALRGVELYSIGVYGEWRGEVHRKVFMVGSGDPGEWLQYFPSERAVLAAFCDWLNQYDPDLLIGWNVINFDLWFLQRLAQKLGQRLPIGRHRRSPYWRDLDDDGERKTVQIPGRAVIDGIEMLRTATYRFESFSLEHVSRELLGEGKLLQGGQRGDEIAGLFHNDKPALAAYNLKDCELVWQIFEHTRLLDFAVARSQMTGLALDRLGGSVAAFDFLYLPRLHRAGYVAPNASRELVASPGGFVLDSEPGIYDDVLVLDFKSLYPSIIRTFYIDPLGLALGVQGGAEAASVAGFLEARFAREPSILRGIIEQLWQLRDAARARGDAAQSQAIKIIMNSFYGVLGTAACRFFDARLASSITRRGHEIIQQTRDRIEQLGDRVIYGDTDSVFVWVRQLDDSLHGDERLAAVAARGDYLQTELNDWWRRQLSARFNIDSLLELEFETHYQRFLMPTVRGSEKGSKKRYAGVIGGPAGPQLVFKGLENVRTDWTLLARRFQSELYRRIFFDEPYEDYVRETVARLERGQLDDELVYRKRLRRRLADYQRNLPPHVQAARLYQDRQLDSPRRGAWIEYVITHQGPEPAAARSAALDYDHYLERQLAPVADGILHFVGNSFEAITGRQFSLF